MSLMNATTNPAEMTRPAILAEIDAICDADTFDEARYAALQNEMGRRWDAIRETMVRAADRGQPLSAEEQRALACGDF